MFDVLVTQAGRSQLASGKMQIKYASLSDAEVYYEPDIVSGSADASVRLYFESSNLPQDNVTFEADDSGLLRPFKNSTEYDVVGGQMVSWSSVKTGGSSLTGSISTDYVTGSQFASLSGELLESSLANFQNLRVLSSYDTVFDDENFELSTNEVTWVISDVAPINVSKNATTLDVNVMDGLFTDPRCSHLKNFMLLDPVNSDVSDARSSMIGERQKLYSTTVRDDISLGLAIYKRQGFCADVDFVSTSRQNNVVCQMFEQHDNKLLKLDVIDYGVMNTTDRKRTTKHVFFAGKMFVDDNGVSTFVHMFTLVFN